jgi:hypothetical protein
MLPIDQLVGRLNAGNMLSRIQSDFWEGHSTATTLTKILDNIHLAVEKDGFSVAVLLDFSKIFDSMWIGISKVEDTIWWFPENSSLEDSSSENSSSENSSPENSSPRIFFGWAEIFSSENSSLATFFAGSFFA